MPGKHHFRLGLSATFLLLFVGATCFSAYLWLGTRDSGFCWEHYAKQYSIDRGGYIHTFYVGAGHSAFYCTITTEKPGPGVFDLDQSNGSYSEWHDSDLCYSPGYFYEQAGLEYIPHPSFNFLGIFLEDGEGLGGIHFRVFHVYAIDVLLASVVLTILSARQNIRLWRKIRRSQLGRCPACNYDLRAHAPGERCPECGSPCPSRPMPA